MQVTEDPKGVEMLRGALGKKLPTGESKRSKHRPAGRVEQPDTSG